MFLFYFIFIYFLDECHSIQILFYKKVTTGKRPLIITLFKDFFLLSYISTKFTVHFRHFSVLLHVYVSTCSLLNVFTIFLLSCF